MLSLTSIVSLESGLVGHVFSQVLPRGARGGMTLWRCSAAAGWFGSDIWSVDSEQGVPGEQGSALGIGWLRGTGVEQRSHHEKLELMSTGTDKTRQCTGTGTLVPVDPHL